MQDGAAAVGRLLGERNEKVAFLLDEGLPISVGLVRAVETTAVASLRHGICLCLVISRTTSVFLSSCFVNLNNIPPSSGNLITRQVPLTSSDVALIGVAEKGYMNVEVSVTLDPAEAGHASRPPRGGEREEATCWQ